MTTKPYITGHYTPVVDEITAEELPVTGRIPAELSGRYFRNGHNPQPGEVPTHWFKGAGMIHGIRLRDGKAEWYRNRWIRTPALDGLPYIGADGIPNLAASGAATNIIAHGGRVLALQEANLPFELTPELDTIGVFDYEGRLTGPMTAHPHVDPASGELVFFGYSPFPPHLTYHVADAKGALVRSEVVEGAGPSLMHDFALTERYVVWLDLPVVFDMREESGIPYRWSDEYPARMGVMPRLGPAVPRWFEVEPAALLHVTNAYEDELGRVVVDGPRFDRSAWEQSWKWWVGAPGYAPEPLVGATAHRWILDPRSGRVTEQPLDDIVTEFPRVRDDNVGRPYRYSYSVGFPGVDLREYALVKHDAVTGTHGLAPLGPGRMPGETVIVPADGGTAEDDGYLLTVVSDLATDASELLVLDARDPAAEPVATITLPRRVPSGIHGNWIDDAQLPDDTA
jgi:carotenoid cleavage dioxygenase-like enzyme